MLALRYLNNYLKAAKDTAAEGVGWAGALNDPPSATGLVVLQGARGCCQFLCRDRRHQMDVFCLSSSHEAPSVFLNLYDL
jgi:hypothetical protein